MRLSFPITKFKKLDDGRLEVEGLASDETIDTQGDIVDYGGLKRAAESWRGNLREQHDPKKAVGKALEVTFDDEKKSMFVRAFISSGAPDTQAKIQDGTIGSYSIGGSNPTNVAYEKIDGRQVRRVLDWQMTELSVVDAPANPNANFELCKADGAGAFVATEILAEEPEPLADATNRFAKSLLAEIEKGKKAPLVGIPAALPGDAKTKETKKPAQGTVTLTKPDALHEEAMSGGTGTGGTSMPGAKSPGGTAPPSSGDVAQSAAPKNPAAKDVEEEGAAAGTARNSDEVEGDHSIPHSIPPDKPAAEAVEGMSPAPGTGQGQSEAPKPAADSVESHDPAPGTGDGHSAAPKATAEGVEDTKTGDEPTATDVKVEDTAEAGGSDTEADLIDGKKKRNPKGTPVNAPTTGKAATAEVEKKDYTADERKEMAASGEAMKDGSFPIKTTADLSNAIQAFGRAKNKGQVKAHIKRRAKALGASDQIPKTWKALESLMTKYFWGGEAQDISTALDLLTWAQSLYSQEAVEGDDESTQLDLLAGIVAGIQRFIAEEGAELVGACPSCGGAGCQTCQTMTVTPKPAPAPAPAKNPGAPDQSMVLEETAKEMADCTGGMALEEAAAAPFGKGVMPLIIDAIARRIAKRYGPPADAPDGIFKVNHGDQLAEGIGKGLSSVLEPITKANVELRAFFESEFKDVRKSIDELGKTAAVPTPLRTVPRDIPPRAESDNGVRALEKALASTTHPESMAHLKQQIAIAKSGVSER